MKLAILADIHAGRDLPHDKAQLDAAIARVVAERCDAALFAGDIFDRANACTPKHSTGAVQAVVAAAFRRLCDAGIPSIVVVGNHDKAGAGSEDCLRFLDVLAPMVRVVREPQVVRIPERGGDPTGGVFVACVPWVYNEDAEATVSELVESQTFDLFGERRTALLAHVQVVGARMAGLKTCDGGSFAVSREYLDSLPFSRFALGDFHARQDLFGGRGGYVGALRQGNFGEEGNPQGFEIWDTETNSVEWIELDAAPRHETHYPANPDGLAAIAESPSPNFRRAVVRGFDVPAEIAAACEAAGVRIDREAAKTERQRRVDEIAVGIMDDPHALIRLWASQQKPPIEGEDLARLLALHDAVTADAIPVAGERGESTVEVCA